MNSLLFEGEPLGPVDTLREIESGAYQHVQELVEAGVLPIDTFLRLDTVGENSEHRRSILLDLSTYEDDTDRQLLITRNVIYGQVPRALITWYPSMARETLHTNYDEPYLVKYDLVDVIRERRVVEGKTVTEAPKDKRWRPPEDIENAQCQRMAHALWSVMAKRIVPEWLKTSALDYYYRPHKIGPGHVVLDSSEQVMRRDIVRSIALGVSHIRNIYDESVKTGVRGIGAQGRADIRTLLAEQYPEFYN